MGILDDAIREHLDLKRRLGAEEDELKRLEGEAFGPPTRPGDPDFPETDTGAQALVDDAPGPDTSSELVAEPPSEELVAEAPATAEEPAAPEPSATAGLFDHSADELDLDLDLDLDEPPASVEDVAPDPPAAEPPAAPEPEPEAAPEPEPPATAESPVEPIGGPPIESLDTVEHHFEGAIDDTGEVELVEGELDEAQPEPGEDDEEKDEDVLEETPEFLRDAPEDDELWFEQGEPKDFDF
jgi:hypothetical protein